MTCIVCGEPATHEAYCLLPNYRSNPASSAYGKDDCVRCFDKKVPCCEKHMDACTPNGYVGGSWRKLS